MKTLIAAIAGLILLQDAPEKVFSGPQKGEPAPAFKVLALTGPEAGKETTWLAEKSDGKDLPAVVCFIHELTRPGAQVIRRLDEHGERNRAALRTLFVSLREDPNEGERALPRSIQSLRLTSPVGISLDGKEGPGAWGLNKVVTLTVVLVTGGKVVENWAIVSPNETDFPPILAAMEKLTQPALDTPEALRAEVLRLRSELAALRVELEEMKRGAGGMRDAPQRQPRMEKREKAAARELPGKAPDDPKLNQLFRRLIRLESPPEEIDGVIREIEAHVGEDAALRGQVKEGIVLLDHLGYGTDHSKSARKKLLEKYGRP